MAAYRVDVSHPDLFAAKKRPFLMGATVWVAADSAKSAIAVTKAALPGWRTLRSSMHPIDIHEIADAPGSAEEIAQ